MKLPVIVNGPKSPSNMERVSVHCAFLEKRGNKVVVDACIFFSFSL